MRKSGDGTISKIQINANFKVTVQEQFKYTDPGLGILNSQKIPSIIFGLPDELKKDGGKITQAWLENMEIPALSIKTTQQGNLSIASSFIKKFRDDNQRLPKFIKLISSKANAKMSYTIEFKRELPKLSDDQKAPDIVFNDFIIYVNKNVNAANKPQLEQPKRLGWVFLPKPKDKSLGKIRKVWVDGIPVSTQDIKFGVNPKNKVAGIFIDIKPFTVNPYFKLHKVVMAAEVMQAVKPVQGGQVEAMQPNQPVQGGQVGTIQSKPVIVRIAYKIQVKFPKQVIALLKGQLKPNQAVQMESNPNLDQQEVTTVVNESSVQAQDVVVVDETLTGTTTETATEAVVVSQDETTATSETENPASNELVTNTETVSSVDEITATNTIDMSAVTTTEPSSAPVPEPIVTASPEVLPVATGNAIQ